MVTRRPTPEHQDAVARRLALLSAEIAGEHTRVRPPPVEVPADVPADVPAEEPPSVAPIPVPGRHASRRSVSLLPEGVRGRIALGSAQLAVVAVLVALGLAVTCWWLLRGRPERLEAPSTPVAATSQTPLTDASPVPVGATTGATPATESVTVDVTGKVRRPGIVVLDPGARVVDALEAAGGAKPGVDLSALNLARVLVDGEQILVGVPQPPGAAASAAASPGGAGGPLVNLNTATETELEALPEVGPVTAQAILAWRDQHGGFTAVDELLEVDGIGDATLGQLAPLVTV